ncbi:MAG: ROK family transcriptional regulator [Brachybacterium sp.]|uniref:ROK family transcriptional regulator n=1 Tax=Brachybacterium sp. AOP42-E1-35 TaxID=3457664 RepID=UPI003FBA588B
MVNWELLTGVSGSVRAINTARVLATIREEGPISRSELIARSGLSKATVSGIVSGLLERDSVRETGKTQPSRGRSRVLLEFNSASMTVIGVQVADDRCQIVRTDLAGSIIDRRDVTVDLNDVAEVTTTLARIIGELADRPGRTVLGVGLGVPGVVDHSGRQVIVALSHNWHDVDLAEDLEHALGLPVTLANRAKVAALGQLVTMPATAATRSGDATSDQPSPRQRTDLVYLYLGSGVVAGIVIGGRLHFGHDGHAGDLGHVMVEPSGPRCVCGTRGCLQALVGREAIVADAGVRTWDELERAVQRGDRAASRAVQRAGDRLGMALGHLVAAVSPSVIAVGGPSVSLGDPLLEAIDGAIRRCAPTAGPLDIVRADEDAPPRGAAMLWLQRAGLLA